MRYSQLRAFVRRRPEPSSIRWQTESSNGFALNVEIKRMPGHEARTGTVVAEYARRLR